MKQLEKILKAVANKRRIAILAFLKTKPEATVGDISRHIKLSFTATSQHLGLLYRVDLVEKDQRSLEVYYSLARNQDRLVKNLLLEL